MRYFKPFSILILSLVLLCGCSRYEDQPETILPEQDNSITSDSAHPQYTPNSGPIQIVVEDDTQPPKEGMVRSPLTNEWIDANTATLRPIAVIIPNESAAIPHYNLAQASILYEANMEGRMTRMMALYEDWADINKIGNIRSARTYFFYWAFEWDAFLVHYGGPYYINPLVEQDLTENLDGLTSDEKIFYRTEDRPKPHNVYVNGDGLTSLIRQKGYSPTYRGLTSENHFHFATKSAPNTLSQYDKNAKDALYIDMSGCYPLTRCYFEYNEDDGLYYRFQHLSGASDGPHTDASGTQLSFKNIIVQYTHQEVLDPQGYLVFQCHDTRDGWFFTNGRGVHVNWTKESDYGATRYFDDNGNEITLNTGKTMICIVDANDSFTFR